MPVLERLTNAIRERNQSYVCRFCEHPFERQRNNCPACGCGTVVPDR